MCVISGRCSYMVGTPASNQALATEVALSSTSGTTTARWIWKPTARTDGTKPSMKHTVISTHFSWGLLSCCRYEKNKLLLWFCVWGRTEQITENKFLIRTKFQKRGEQNQKASNSKTRKPLPSKQEIKNCVEKIRGTARQEMAIDSGGKMFLLNELSPLDEERKAFKVISLQNIWSRNLWLNPKFQIWAKKWNNNWLFQLLETDRELWGIWPKPTA